MASQELADARRLVRNVGGNLNDVAKHANATGEIHAGTRQVLGMVARAVAQGRGRSGGDGRRGGGGPGRAAARAAVTWVMR